jgi:hypothetical protein
MRFSADSTVEEDAEALLQLGLRGFQGPEWDSYANGLCRYAIGTITKMLLGRRPLMSGPAAKRVGRIDLHECDREEAVEIANMAAAAAILAFQKDILPTGRWKASENTTLRTFFVGQCQIQLRNVYRSWKRQHGWHPDRVDNIPEMASQGIDAYARCLIREFLGRRKSWSPVEIVGLQKAGFQLGEIAGAMGITDAAVKNRTLRLRKNNAVIPTEAANGVHANAA